MEITINHNKTNLPEPSSLLALLQAQDLHEKKGIAVAVNNKVVSKMNWHSYQLKANDFVTIIKATQGG